MTIKNCKYTYFYIHDHLGSTSMVLDVDGNISQSVSYIPYGEIFVEERNGAWNSPYLFNSKELDEETGLYYYGARYLNPTNGMWLSVDPLWEKYVGMSPYNYCAGNPVKLVDPDGMKLRYSQGATEAFKGNFKSACSYLRKHDAGQILSKIEQSESTVFIKEITNRSSYYSPKKKTIFWNPYQGLETTDGKLLSPTTVLNHEADHALDDIENPVEHNRNRKTSDANFDNKEERRVILGTETETAIKLGEIEKGQISRDDHSGYETRTSSPISKDAIFVNYPTLDEVEVIFEQSKCDEK